MPMERLKRNIRNHSVKMLILWWGLMAIMIIVMLVNSINPKSLTSYCKVYDEEDLNRCWKENPYVEIHTTGVYDAEYNYSKDNHVVAHFVDIDINGYSMISLLSKDLATTLIKDTSENIIIKGKLETFDKDVKAQAYTAIQEMYVEYLEEEATREQVLGNFTLVQFNEYQGSKSSLYWGFTLGLIIIIGFFVLGFRQIKYILHPEQYRINKNTTVMDEEKVKAILKELEEGPFDYHYKNIYLTKHYLIIKGGGIQVAERKNVAWIYEKIMKQYGITTNKFWFVYSFDQKNPFNLNVPGKQHKELGEILQKGFPNATFGYDVEKQNQWKKEPESFIKENNEEDR